MQNDLLTVLLIEDSPDYAALVQRWLAPDGEDDTWTINWSDTLAAGLRRLAVGGVDLVLLDLGLPDSDGVETFDAIRNAAATTPIIVLTGEENERAALKMIQHGAQDYVFKRTCTEALLRRSLRYAVTRSQAQMAQRQPESSSEEKRIIGVLGSCGGVGATTVASVLAADLRHLTGQSVLAADLDLNHGTMSFHLGVNTERSLVDAVQNLDRLDHDVWNGIVAHRTGELDVLASPGYMGGSTLDPKDVEQVFRRVKKFYDWIVLDLGRLDASSAHAMSWCTDVLLVTALGISSLYQTKRTLDALERLGVPLEQIRLIVNERGEKCELSRKELQNLFGVEVTAQLPSAPDELYQAYMQKRLPSVSSAFRKEVTLAALRLAGLPEEKPRTTQSTLGFIASRFRPNSKTAEKTGSR